MEYYSANKKNERMPFAGTWRDLEMILLSEVSQREKDRYYMISLICGISKTAQMNLFTKQKQIHIENNLRVTRASSSFSPTLCPLPTSSSHSLVILPLLLGITH